MQKSFLFIFFLLNIYIVAAQKNDSVFSVNLDEVRIIPSIKENGKMRLQPTSVSLLNSRQLTERNIHSLKAISAIVPNFYVPNYGSSLTSAVYIRGVGSRINTPAVGMYVDGIPYVDKSAFDFYFYDIERIDVLKGPQGTLYGRNTMGGMISIHTRNPFDYEGGNINFSYSIKDNRRVFSATHYHRVNEQFAFSGGGYYGGADGLFRNSTLDKKIGGKENAGLRMRGIYRPDQKLQFDFNVGYDYTDESAYPYFYTGSVLDKEEYPELIGKISNNHEHRYRRGLFNSGLAIKFDADRYVVNAVTGFQNVNDRMFLDQDFIQPNIYTLEQRQNINTLTEEITLKNKTGDSWQTLTGVSFMYQWLKTTGPVTFYKDGVNWLEQTINNNMPDLSAQGMKMSVDIVNEDLLMDGVFQTPTLSLSSFHQSTFKFTDRFSASLGARLNWDHNSLNYSSNGLMDYNFLMNSSKMPISLTDHHVETPYEGLIKKDYVDVLPKLTLKYDMSEDNNVFLTISKGMRSGGYNVQMFSDILQSSLRNAMMSDIKLGCNNTLDVLEKKGMPLPVINLIKSNLEKMPITENPDVKTTTVYAPEYTWNYELGTHLNNSSHTLQADVALYYMHTRDQQIARFTNSGLGRLMVNAGQSESFGAELSTKWNATKNLTFMGSLGSTHSKFTDYDCANNQDYKGNYVPFVPKHTVNFDIAYTWYLNCALLKNISLGATYNGVGKIYWTENNSAYQQYYQELATRIVANTSNVTIQLWGRNITNSHYNTFYFESAGRGFEQHCMPLQLGVDIKLHF